MDEFAQSLRLPCATNFRFRLAPISDDLVRRIGLPKRQYAVEFLIFASGLRDAERL